MLPWAEEERIGEIWKTWKAWQGKYGEGTAADSGQPHPSFGLESADSRAACVQRP